MERRKNPALPEHLRHVDTALDWAFANGFQHDDMSEFDERTYKDLIHAINHPVVDDGDWLRDDEREAYLRERAFDVTQDIVSMLLRFERQDEVTIYRAVDLVSRSDLVFDGIGVYWAFDSNCAESHWGGIGEEYKLKGVTRPENVDWEMTYLSALSFDDECEIRLLEGAPILITAINGEELDPPIEATA